MIAALIHNIRRNHALEHATITLLSQKYLGEQIVGISGPIGFTFYTTLSTEEVVPIAMKALQQLKAGKEELRIHPNCGTNLVATAVLTTLAAVIGLGSSKKRSRLECLQRFPHAVLLSAVAILASRPLGIWLQAYVTTEANLKNTEITTIFTDRWYGLHRIRIYTRHSA